MRPDYERASVQAVMSIYGVELLPDNAQACRERLYEIWNEAYSGACAKDANDACRDAVKFILEKNILCGDALTMRQGKGGKEDPPIIFAEWSFIDGSLVKRRDYRLDKLIEANERQKDAFLPVEDEYVGYDWDKREFIPKPIREYAPTHYRRLGADGR